MAEQKQFQSFDEAQAALEGVLNGGQMAQGIPTVEVPVDAEVELDETLYTYEEGDEPIYVQGADGRVIQILSAKLVESPVTEEAPEEIVEEVPEELPEELPPEDTLEDFAGEEEIIE